MNMPSCRHTAKRQLSLYITKNGEGDLVVMSVDAYEDLKNRLNDAEERARAKINECGQIK